MLTVCHFSLLKDVGGFSCVATLHTYLCGHSLSEQFYQSKTYFLILSQFWDLLIVFFSLLGLYMMGIQLEKNTYPHLVLHALKTNVPYSQLSFEWFMGTVGVTARSSQLIFGFCMVKAMRQIFISVAGILTLIEQIRTRV